MLGYPGAGKTTTAEVIHELTGAEHLSSDKLRLELFPRPSFSPEEHDTLYQTLDERTEALLGQGKDVIYDANLNRYQHRQDKYAICQRTGAQPKLIWVQTPKEIARQRATDPQRQQLVPLGETLPQMFDRIAGIIEEPLENEPHITVDGTKVTPEYITNKLDI